MSNIIDLYKIPVERIDNIWTRISPYIASFVSRSFGRYEIEDVLGAVRDGIFQIWVVVSQDEIRAVLITQIYDFPRLRELQIIMCAGKNRHEWFHLLKKIENYAADIKAQRISAVIRLGWQKELMNVGYKKTHLYLEKEI